VFTHDASVPDRFWLTRDYLPEHAGLWAGRPALTELAGAIAARTEPVPIPWDCADGFYEAYWRRPEAYLDEHVRCGMSIWARVGPDAEQRAVRSLRDDLGCTMVTTDEGARAGRGGSQGPFEMSAVDFDFGPVSGPSGSPRSAGPRPGSPGLPVPGP